VPSLHWIGKDAVLNHHREIPFRLLRDPLGVSRTMNHAPRPALAIDPAEALRVD
jgi:hypothetical protein